ncbi:hypothetical protein HY745_09905 [Candidatus Desantisbacteria bacterium]|nr:hypothetical protein [Candidatus Desantisbacteria bacterium]
MRKRHKRLRIHLADKIKNEQELLIDSFMLVIKVVIVLFIFYWLFRP